MMLGTTGPNDQPTRRHVTPLAVTYSKPPTPQLTQSLQKSRTQDPLNRYLYSSSRREAHARSPAAVMVTEIANEPPCKRRGRARDSSEVHLYGAV
jgi:hypothetical protein